MLALAGLVLAFLQDPGTLTVAEGAVAQPQLAIAAAPDGPEVHVTFVRDGSRVAVRSLRAGGAFDAEVAIPGAVTVAGALRGPRIAAAAGFVCVSAIVFDRERGRDGELTAWRSGDAGRTFEGPFAVSDAPGAAREGLHDMAVAADGTLGCAWLDLRGGRTELRASFSGDGGGTWSPNLLVYRSPDGSVCECCAPAVAFDRDGRFLVLFRNSLAGRRDMWLASGGPGGFAKAEKLGRDGWPLSACPMAPGALAADAPGELALWRREERIFRGAPERHEREIGRGGELAAASGAGGAWAAWIEAGAGSPLRLLRPGAAEPELLASGARWPALAAARGADGPLALAWEDHSAARVALRLCLLPAPAAGPAAKD
jgi:hypothetical protein